MTTLSDSSAAKLKVVVDTSIYVAAVLRPGLSEDVLRIIYEGYAELYCSAAIYSELTNCLDNKPFNINPVRADLVLRKIKLFARFVETQPLKETQLRDQADLHIIECAVATKANLIVTLDKDLLGLKTSHSVAIIHPRAFRWMVTES